MQKIKSKFLKNVALNIAINGAFQRNRIYSEDVKGLDRKLLRKELRLELDKILIAIKSAKTYNDENHFQTIDKFSKDFTQLHKKLLNNKKLNIGTSQKLINLYWKMQWLFDKKTPTPIHCPFDNIIIKQMKELKGMRWTKIVNLSDYKKMVQLARTLSEGYESIAAWELDIYNKDIHESGEVSF